MIGTVEYAITENKFQNLVGGDLNNFEKPSVIQVSMAKKKNPNPIPPPIPARAIKTPLLMIRPILMYSKRRNKKLIPNKEVRKII